MHRFPIKPLNLLLYTLSIIINFSCTTEDMPESVYDANIGVIEDMPANIPISLNLYDGQSQDENTTIEFNIEINYWSHEECIPAIYYTHRFHHITITSDSFSKVLAVKESTENDVNSNNIESIDLVHENLSNTVLFDIGNAKYLFRFIDIVPQCDVAINRMWDKYDGSKNAHYEKELREEFLKVRMVIEKI